MNETLKAVGNIGAELAEAKAEIQRQRERHRTTRAQLEQVTGLLREFAEYLPYPGQIERITAALSLQAEPVEPAPAQDEREMTAGRAANLMRRFKSEEKMLGPNEQAAIDYVLKLLANSPAQKHIEDVKSEQQPSVRITLVENDPHGGTYIRQWDNLAGLGAGLHLLYAAPIAQTEQQPKIDYKRKFECLVEHAKRQDKAIADMRYDENIRRYYDDGAVWFWAGDDSDNLETLACPVVINAGDLRALIAQTAPRCQCDRLLEENETLESQERYREQERLVAVEEADQLRAEVEALRKAISPLVDIAHERRHSLMQQRFSDNDEGDAFARHRDVQVGRIARIIDAAMAAKEE